jgi:hypothetical protein
MSSGLRFSGHEPTVTEARMNAGDFDKIARAMASTRSRRGLLMAFAAGLGTAALGAFVGPASAIRTCTYDNDCPLYERCAARTCVASPAPSNGMWCSDCEKVYFYCHSGCVGHDAWADFAPCEQKCGEQSAACRKTCVN